MKLTASFAGSLQADIQAELPTPVVGQRDVRRARVLPAEAPRGLAVSDRKDVHARVLRLRRCRPLSNQPHPTLPPAPTSGP
jgi:hypothetical protein